MDPEPVDPLITLRAELDQFIAMAPEMARTVRAAFDSYIAEGFTESQALYLTVAQIMTPPQHPKP